MDDVEDDSELRRGVPVAHAIYGVPQTINTANYVYFLAFQELLKLRDENGSDDQGHDLASMVTDEMLSLHRGQGMELFWRDSLTCPTEEEYVQMVLGSESMDRENAQLSSAGYRTDFRNRRAVPYRRQAHDGQVEEAASVSYYCC